MKEDCLVHPTDDTIRAQRAIDGTGPSIGGETLHVSKTLIVSPTSYGLVINCIIKSTASPILECQEGALAVVQGSLLEHR